MTNKVFVRAVAGALAAAAISGLAFAQSQSPSQPQPLTMTDTAPAPASERSSMGAVILMDQPVLAQRAAMLAAQERSAIDTRAMGAGPARVLRDVQLEQGKAKEAAPKK